jgi:16S rRNA A1518/A1519 N6-dimethyltransferase RsmA/KsgA/DIM1 with predicted DNA glycosylase/AP lyase activity
MRFQMQKVVRSYTLCSNNPYLILSEIFCLSFKIGNPKDTISALLFQNEIIGDHFLFMLSS